jgi:hypothetical protein
VKFRGCEVSKLAARLSAAYFDEVERKRIKELVCNQHGVEPIRSRNILDRVVPVYFYAALASSPCLKFLLLNSPKSRTRFHEVNILDRRASMWEL